MRVAAIVPARGGSKRIPGKNLAYVGRGYARDMSPWSGTLLARAVHAASACDSVTVSTDDRDIRLAAESWPIIRVHDRPTHLASDHAQIESAVAHWWTRLDEKPDALCILQCTSPFRTAAHVKRAIELLEATGADSVIGVTAGHDGHFAGRLKPRETSGVTWWEWQAFAPADRDRPRTQDLPPRGVENGSLYLTRRAAWEKSGNRMSGSIVALPMSKVEGWDIDSIEDLQAARALADGMGL